MPKRKRLTNAEKANVVELSKSCGRTTAAHKYDISVSSVSAILKSEEEILREAARNPNGRSSKKKTILAYLEDNLFESLQEVLDTGCSMDAAGLMIKAEEIRTFFLKIPASNFSDDERGQLEKFTVTMPWVKDFVIRKHLRSSVSLPEEPISDEIMQLLNWHSRLGSDKNAPSIVNTPSIDSSACVSPSRSSFPFFSRIPDGRQ